MHYAHAQMLRVYMPIYSDSTYKDSNLLYKSCNWTAESSAICNLSLYSSCTLCDKKAKKLDTIVTVNMSKCVYLCSYNYDSFIVIYPK